MINDIILSVVQAASPAEASKAQRRLAALSGTPIEEGADFGQRLREVISAQKTGQEGHDLLADVMNNAEPTRKRLAMERLAALSGIDEPLRLAGPPNDTGERLEASILTHMYGEMMPKQANGIHGTGNAGQIWQQMFTEKIAEASAKRSPLGLSEQLGLSGKLEGQDGELRRRPFFSGYEVKSYAG